MRNQPTGPDIAALLADSVLRRHGALALLNLGYVAAAREVLAGGYPDWPTLMEARAMTERATVWWVAIDVDTFAWLRMRVATPDRRRTPIAVDFAA